MRVDASKIDHSRGNTRKSLTVSRITALPVPPLVHIRSRRSSLKSESCLPDRFARRAREFLPHPFRLNAIYTPVKSLRRSVVARQRCVYARYRTRSYKYTKFPRQFYSIFLSKLDEREKAEGFKDSREDDRRDKLKGKTLTWPMIFTRWSMTVLLVKHAPPWASLLVDDPFPWLLVIVDLDSIEDRGGSSRLSLPAIAIYVNTARLDYLWTEDRRVSTRFVCRRIINVSMARRSREKTWLASTRPFAACLFWRHSLSSSSSSSLSSSPSPLALSQYFEFSRCTGIYRLCHHTRKLAPACLSILQNYYGIYRLRERIWPASYFSKYVRLRGIRFPRKKKEKERE